jgi:hypothetical protein
MKMISCQVLLDNLKKKKKKTSVRLFGHSVVSRRPVLLTDHPDASGKGKKNKDFGFEPCIP